MNGAQNQVLNEWCNEKGSRLGWETPVSICGQREALATPFPCAHVCYFPSIRTQRTLSKCHFKEGNSPVFLIKHIISSKQAREATRS